MILTSKFEPDLDWVMLNRHTTYLGHT